MYLILFCRLLPDIFYALSCFIGTSVKNFSRERSAGVKNPALIFFMRAGRMLEER
jgi:hypothetical protein